MGGLGCNAPFKYLESAAKDDDRHIRTMAVKGLGACQDENPARQSLLREALEDKEPEVRLVTLRVMLSNGISNIASDRIGALATSDPWPDVRARSVANTRHFNSKLAADILTKTQDDPSGKVRTATVEAAIPIPGKRIDQIIEARLSDTNEKARTKKIAAFAAGIRCQKTALPLLFEVLKKGAEPLAAERDISVAEAAAKAMGAIGTEEALELLKKARRRSNPATDKAIDTAIGAAPGRCILKSRMNKKSISKNQ
jgi:HEAT repeat protein